MFSEIDHTNSRPAEPLRCLPLRRALAHGFDLCSLAGFGDGSLAKASEHLLDTYYPQPPQDVFERVMAANHRRQGLWLTSDANGMLGLVMLSPHSKGGQLENLALAHSSRGRGVGQQLVQALLQIGHEYPAMVNLTTLLPSFLSPFGFQPSGELVDSSTTILILLPSPAISGTLAQ